MNQDILIEIYTKSSNGHFRLHYTKIPEVFYAM